MSRYDEIATVLTSIRSSVPKVTLNQEREPQEVLSLLENKIAALVGRVGVNLHLRFTTAYWRRDWREGRRHTTLLSVLDSLIATAKSLVACERDNAYVDAVKDEAEETPIPTPARELRRLLREQGLTQDEAADRLDVSRYSVNQIVNSRRTVTAEMALKLEGLYPNYPAEHWLRLQNHHDLRRLRDAARNEA